MTTEILKFWRKIESVREWLLLSDHINSYHNSNNRRSRRIQENIVWICIVKSVDNTTNDDGRRRRERERGTKISDKKTMSINNAVSPHSPLLYCFDWLWNLIQQQNPFHSVTNVCIHQNITKYKRKPQKAIKTNTIEEKQRLGTICNKLSYPQKKSSRVKENML